MLRLADFHNAFKTDCYASRIGTNEATNQGGYQIL